MSIRYAKENDREKERERERGERDRESESESKILVKSPKPRNKINKINKGWWQEIIAYCANYHAKLSASILCRAKVSEL